MEEEEEEEEDDDDDDEEEEEDNDDDEEDDDEAEDEEAGLREGRCERWRSWAGAKTKVEREAELLHVGTPLSWEERRGESQILSYARMIWRENLN